MGSQATLIVPVPQALAEACSPVGVGGAGGGGQVPGALTVIGPAGAELPVKPEPAAVSE